MLKRNSLITVVALMAMLFMSGCSQSDGNSTSESTSTVSTEALLGVDSNDNGVRDDVEAKIYEKYDKPLHRALLMDGAKQFQKVLLEPSNKAIETQKSIARIIHCKVYLRRIDSEIKSNNFEFIKFLENITFDTPERVKKYLDYNLALSGGNFASSPSDWNREECSAETIAALEVMGL